MRTITKAITFAAILTTVTAIETVSAETTGPVAPATQAPEPQAPRPQVVAALDTSPSENELSTSLDGPNTAEANRLNTNINANPFYLLLGGGIHAAVSFRWDESKAVGPVISTFSVPGSRISTFGVQGQYHLKENDVMGKGLILDNSVEWVSTSIEVFGEEQNTNSIMVTSSVNWQWFYENGFNIRAGLGIASQVALDDQAGYENLSGFAEMSFGDNVAAHVFGSGKVAWAF